jgi:hypothetical protein
MRTQSAQGQAEPGYRRMPRTASDARVGAAARCVALAALVTALTASSGARAETPPPTGFSSPGYEVPDLSAWTLRAGELELGPTAVHLGFADVFQVGTRFALNLFGALNADLKWTIHKSDTVAVGVELGVLRFDPSLVGIDEAFSVWAVPISARVSGRPSDDFRVHGRVDFLIARPDSEAPDSVKRIQRYLGPVGRLAVTLGAEWRANDNLALVAELESPLILHRETFRYEGEDAASDFLRATLALQVAYSSLSLRVGGGYGPSWLGESGWFPVFEIALRLY